MKQILRASWLSLCLLLFAVSAAFSNPADEEKNPSQYASEILAEAGIPGGLIVHLGCGDGRLTAALYGGDGFLVQGLDTDPKKVEASRQHIQSLGLYGSVSADQFDGKRLPYVDNSVNLVVAEELGRLKKKELLRALVPDGVAWIGGKKVVKPRPAGIDDWTHFLHDANNNAVAQDAEVGPPHRIRWVADPKHSRSHHFHSSISTMVSAGGKLFYIIDEGSTSLHDFTPARWSLVARDAFNGVTLWRLPIQSWVPVHQGGTGHAGRFMFAPDLFRRLVAVDDRVFTTLSIFGPVSALDAATGKTIRTYAGTEKTEEVIYHDGILYCAQTTKKPSDIDRRRMGKSIEELIQKRILAIDAETGKQRWAVEGKDANGYQSLTLIAQGKRVLFQNTEAILCLDSKTGRELWRREQTSVLHRTAYHPPTLLISDGVVLSADRQQKGTSEKVRGLKATLFALSAESGEELWQCDSVEGFNSAAEVLVVDGKVWTGNSVKHQRHDFRVVRDLRTGEILQTYPESEDWFPHHHYRCYPTKGTSRFLLTSRHGIEFTELGGGELTAHDFIRGICRYGVMPANGLLYLPPDQCACDNLGKLVGFYAVAPKAESQPAYLNLTDPARLTHGPAYGSMDPSELESHGKEDWPTFRHDGERSGQASTRLESALGEKWSTNLGGRLSTLVSANGRLYVAQRDSHAVICLDADDGGELWRFTAGGGVDSPPTIARGIAVFGSRDGSVYALRASDGALIWKFKAALGDQRLVARDQLESVWPVHGSTLVEKGAVYVAAGRNAYFDQGVCLYKLDLATGKPLSAKRHYGRDSETSRRIDLFTLPLPKGQKRARMTGLKADVFSSGGNSLFLGGVAVSRDLDLIGDGQPHLMSHMKLLDPESYERSFWIYGTYQDTGKRAYPIGPGGEIGGVIMAFDDTSVYGYNDPTSDIGTGVYAAIKIPEPVEVEFNSRVLKGRAAKKNLKWRREEVPVNVRAMLLSGDLIVLAGPERFDEKAVDHRLHEIPTSEWNLDPLLADALDTVEGRKGSLVWIINKADGTKLHSLELESTPVFDGMIAANEQVYLSTLDGRVICLASE